MRRADEDDDNDPHSSSDDVADTGRLLPWPMILITCSLAVSLALTEQQRRCGSTPSVPSLRAEHTIEFVRGALSDRSFTGGAWRAGSTRAGSEETQQHRASRRNIVFLLSHIINVYIEQRFNSLAAPPDAAWILARRECI